eukprot:4100346-Pyramimonas_sp.AAC.1
MLQLRALQTISALARSAITVAHEGSSPAAVHGEALSPAQIVVATRYLHENYHLSAEQREL